MRTSQKLGQQINPINIQNDQSNEECGEHNAYFDDSRTIS